MYVNHLWKHNWREWAIVSALNLQIALVFMQSLFEVNPVAKDCTDARSCLHFCTLRWTVYIWLSAMNITFIHTFFFSGLPGHGGTTWTSVSTRETFYSRIMVLLSGLSLSESWPYFLWIFTYCPLYESLQPMMGSMQALSVVIRKASANNFVGSAILNLLQSQV